MRGLVLGCLVVTKRILAFFTSGISSVRAADAATVSGCKMLIKQFCELCLEMICALCFSDGLLI
jgi:hypothetical protein